MQLKTFVLASVLILGALSTHTIAAANEDFEGVSEWSAPANLH